MSNHSEQDNETPDSEVLLTRIVSDRLGSYGDELVDLVVALAGHSGRLSRLMKVFGLEPSTDLNEQLEILVKYLETEGRDKFLMRSRYEMWKELQKGEEMLSTVRRGDTWHPHESQNRSKWRWIDSDGYVGPDRRRGDPDRRGSGGDAERAHDERRLNPVGRRASDHENHSES